MLKIEIANATCTTVKRLRQRELQQRAFLKSLSMDDDQIDGFIQVMYREARKQNEQIRGVFSRIANDHRTSTINNIINS